MPQIFGSIFPFIETDDASLVFGRHVANYEFLKALLEYGSFDEYHLFCMNTHHFELTKKRLISAPVPDSQKAKVKLFLYNYLVDNLKVHHYKVFHLGGWGYFFAGLVYLRNRYALNKFPITAIIHSLNGMETNYHAMKMCTAPLLPYDTVICSSLAGREVIRKIFDYTTTASSPVPEWLCYKGRFATIPLGIDQSFKQLDKAKCREMFGIPKAATVLLTIGRISPHTKYDPLPLLMTFARIVKGLSHHNPMLIIAGGGNESQIEILRKSIAELGLSDAVLCIANFDADIKTYLYNSADIYLSLSDNLQETFGISVIEAMGCGLPCIVSDLDGYKELVVQNETGIKISTHWIDTHPMGELADIMDFNTMQLMLGQCMAIDSEELFHALTTLIEDSDKRLNMSSRAQRRCNELFRWSSIMVKYEELWDCLHHESVHYNGFFGTGNNPYMTQYTEAFSHYPTHIISSKDIITITSFGRESLASGTLPAPYSDSGPLLDTRCIREILHALGSCEMSAESLLSKHQESSRDQCKFTLLWMAKYCLVSIKTGTHPSLSKP